MTQTQIDTITREAAIAAHQTGYYRVELAPDGAVETYTDSNSTDYRHGNRRVLSVGTGAIACNCDACYAGDDPADWAGDDVDALLHYEDIIMEAAIEQ